MADSPLVSIITPSYNQASFLEATIHSVLSQDYASIEYIVIDGGSTDGSVEVISRYANHIAYWVSEPDHGQSHAINKGFARAHGDIVAWLNSDDLYTGGAVSEAVDCLLYNAQVGMVYSNCLLIDEESRVMGWSKSRQFDLLDLLSFSIIPQPTVFLRKQVINFVGGLDPSLHLLFDHQMWTRVLASHPILYKDRYWAAARMHSESKNSTTLGEFQQGGDPTSRWLGNDPYHSQSNDRSCEPYPRRSSSILWKLRLDERRCTICSPLLRSLYHAASRHTATLLAAGVRSAFNGSRHCPPRARYRGPAPMAAPHDKQSCNSGTQREVGGG